jgi:hypothetical protein
MAAPAAITTASETSVLVFLMLSCARGPNRAVLLKSGLIYVLLASISGSSPAFECELGLHMLDR